MLGGDETLNLIKKAQDGDEKAKSELIEHNMPLIKSIVKRFKGRNVEYDDLIQLGSMGLLKAINNFNIGFNVRFSTYAVPMIAGEIKRFLRDDGSIKVSRALKMLSAKINNYIDEQKNQKDTEPTINEIATKFEISPHDVIFALDSSKYPLSIYDKSDNENGTELLSRLSTEDNNDEFIDKLLIKDVIMSLPEREKKIILLRYYRDKTQSEIAEEFGISQVQISRIENKIIEKLRENLRTTE